ALFGDDTTYGKKCVFKGQYNEAAGLLRPAFYLKKSFFKTSRVDLRKMSENGWGDSIKDIILEECTTQELLDIYSVEECKKYLGLDIDIDYIKLELKSGKDIGNAELLDTVIASSENESVDEFYWMVSDDGGNNWSDVESAEGNSFILTAEYAGKLLRCTAESNGVQIYSSALNIPDYEVITPENVKSVPDNFVGETPNEYRFTVDGKEFALLDDFDNNESTFYVTTVNQYGDLNVLSQNYENATEKDMTYDSYVSVKNFLNKDFLTKGNNLAVLGKDSSIYYKLPDEIIDNINYNHVWYRYVAPRFVSDGVPETYKAGVSLLSWTDFTTYAGKFGVADVFKDDNLSGAIVYFLRDTNEWGDYTSIAVIKNLGLSQYIFNNIQPSNAKAALVRPAFYLKKDFFKTVKLDLSKTGEAVLDVMRGRYYIEDLIDIYSEQELIEYGFTRMYSMQTTYTLYNGTQELESLDGVSSLQANVKIRNRGDADTDAMLLMAVYNENGKMIKIVKELVSLKANSDTDATIAMPSLPDGVTSGYKVSLMLWNNIEEMCSLASKLTFRDRGNINGDTIKIGSDVIGNIFTDAEDVKIRINSTDLNVSYRITDYNDKLVTEETVKTVNNVAELDLNSLDVGYYEIAVQNGDVFDNTAEKKVTSFAIIPEYDFSNVTNSPFGINTHFENDWLGWSIDTIPLLKKAGIKSVRDGYYWGSMEQEKGVYENYWFFTNEQSKLRSAGIDYMYVTVGYCKYYDNGAAPYSEEGIEGFANYSKKATELYNHQFGDYKLKYMDMYNEWYTVAGDQGDGPADSSADNYIKVFKKVHETMKASYPEVCLFMGLADDNEESEKILRLGALDYCDGYEIHPYNWWDKVEDPENETYGVGVRIDKIRNTVAKYNTDNKDLKFWITENGWPSINIPKWGYVITEKEQAEYLVRSYAIALSKGVERMYWYDFTNDRPQSDPYDDEACKYNGEYNFGLIRSGFDGIYGAHTPKRAYVTYANLTRELANKEFVSLDEIDDGVGKIYQYHFKGDGKTTTIACYVVLDGSEENPVKELTITASENVTVKNIEGKVLQTAARGKDIKLELSSAPVYIEGEYTVKQ
ncbi:MAG: hypothetical protein ACI4DY_00340, partial [Monoglobaceae bacterium]